ncbi:serine hydrolase domain-containing protein [Streptomyces sp. NPDC054904]
MRRMSVVGLVSLVSWLLLELAGPAAATERAPAVVADFDRTDAYVAEQRARTRSPGLAYAVISDGRVIHQRTWGRDGNGAPITPRTPFLIGSVSKPVTAMAVMGLVEKGRLDLDGPVAGHLSWFRPSGPGADRITVRHLLNHTSGISEDDGYRRTDRYDNESGGVLRLARSLAGVRLAHPPGARHDYSDANYMLLGAVIEAVAGRPFGDHLREAVLEPLGMTGALADARTAARAGLAPGHRYFFGRPQKYAPPFDASGVPYGYLGATIEDLSRFALAQLGGPPSVVSPDGLHEMHTGTAPVRSHHYGLGWRDSLLEDVGVRAAWHGGATPGYHSIVIAVPERKVAVVLAQNIYGNQNDELLNAAAFGTLRILLGAEPEQASADPLLSRLPTALAAITTALGAAAIRSLLHLFRPRRAGGRGRRRILAGGILAVATCGLLAVASYAVLPGLIATDLRQVLLFAPDVGRMLITVTVLALGLALLRAAIAVRLLKHAAKSATVSGTRSQGRRENRTGRTT